VCVVVVVGGSGRVGARTREEQQHARRCGAFTRLGAYTLVNGEDPSDRMRKRVENAILANEESHCGGVKGDI
jgi:hypothetical protein